MMFYISKKETDQTDAIEFKLSNGSISVNAASESERYCYDLRTIEYTIFSDTTVNEIVEAANNCKIPEKGN